MKSAKIVPATAARSWLFPKISANPLFTLAEKRRFYHPKLPALRAEVDGLAQKSARLFSCFAACGSVFCRKLPAGLLLLRLLFPQHPRTSAQRPVLGLLAGTRSAVSGKPHKPPTRARRCGTGWRSQVHLLRRRILLLQNLLTELLQRLMFPLHTIGVHLFAQHFFLCRI